jgi:hypothetical protein
LAHVGCELCPWICLHYGIQDWAHELPVHDIFLLSGLGEDSNIRCCRVDVCWVDRRATVKSHFEAVKFINVENVPYLGLEHSGFLFNVESNGIEVRLCLIASMSSDTNFRGWRRGQSFHACNADAIWSNLLERDVVELGNDILGYC